MTAEGLLSMFETCSAIEKVMKLTDKAIALLLVFFCFIFYVVNRP